MKNQIAKFVGLVLLVLVFGYVAFLIFYYVQNPTQTCDYPENRNSEIGKCVDGFGLE